MTLLGTIAAGVGFFALLMTSIALHEVGHLVPAKVFGIKVTQYFVGFGRTLWSRPWGETEVGVKTFPLGGYVRLLGMYPPPGPGVPTGRLASLAEQARAAEYEQITPADDGRLFWQKPVRQRLVVMACGPLTNLLLAFVILLGVNLIHGVSQPTTSVAAVSDCVVAVDRANPNCTTGDPESPAKKAGLRADDRIVAFNATPITDWDDLSTLIRNNLDGPATITVQRGEERVVLPTVHTIVTGVPDRLDPSRTVEAGFLGVTPSTVVVHPGPRGTAQQLWTLTEQSAIALVRLPVSVWNVTVDLVTGQPRGLDGPVSIVGASVVAGQLATTDQLSVGDRVASWFSMLASVNLFVFLLNCVPLPPLDGGHMAGAVYEALRRRVSRLLGRPDPGPFDTAKLLPVVYVVGLFLLLCGVILIAADIIDPIKLF